MATILTGAAIGLVIAALDRAVRGARRAHNRRLAGEAAAAGATVGAAALEEGEEPRALERYAWEGVSRPMQMADLSPISIPASLVAIVYGCAGSWRMCYIQISGLQDQSLVPSHELVSNRPPTAAPPRPRSFMVLVLVALYTATTTANITAVVLQKAIRGLPDLPGKAVVTWVEYVDDLAHYGVAAAGMPWDDAGPTEDALIDAVRSGDAAALVLNRPFLLAKTAQMCDVSVLPGDFAPANQAIAFSAGFDNAPLLAAVDEALVLLRERGDALLLEQRYFDVPLPVCKEPE